MNKDEALRLALEALESLRGFHICSGISCDGVITAIKQALAQPEQEPVAWGVDWGKAGDSPCVSIIKRLPGGGIEVVAVEYGPKREPLTDEEIKRMAAPLFMSHYWSLCNEFARAIEAAHGIKGVRCE